MIKSLKWNDVKDIYCLEEKRIAFSQNANISIKLKHCDGAKVAYILFSVKTGMIGTLL